MRKLRLLFLATLVLGAGLLLWVGKMSYGLAGDYGPPVLSEGTDMELDGGEVVFRYSLVNDAPTTVEYRYWYYQDGVETRADASVVEPGGSFFFVARVAAEDEGVDKLRLVVRTDGEAEPVADVTRHVRGTKSPPSLDGRESEGG